MPSSSASVAATPSSSPFDEPPLDVAPLLRRVAGTVRSEPLRRRGVDAIGGHAVDQLRLLAALREADRAQIALDELGHDPRRVAERARADPELGVEQLRVPQRDRPLGARRGVVADRRCVDAEQRVRELAGVRDRRGGEQELRLRPVDAREAPQPAQHVGDVRAEDAAVDVRLVDDDVAQVVQHVGPEVVPRQHADVEHVGVREHEVRPLADLPAPLGRRVAVVDRRAHAAARRARRARAPGPARAPSSDRDRARGSSARVRARRAPGG